jgi:hypothetical protein
LRRELETLASDLMVDLAVDEKVAMAGGQK